MKRLAFALVIILAGFSGMVEASRKVRTHVTHDTLSFGETGPASRFSMLTVETETSGQDTNIKIVSSSINGIVIHNMTREDAIRLKAALESALQE